LTLLLTRKLIILIRLKDFFFIKLEAHKRFIPLNLACRVAAGDSFKWINDCDYNGNDLVIITNGTKAKSLMRCAEACFANNNCNFFTFNSKSSICTLKTVTVMSFIQIVFNQPGSLCGLIDKRLLSSGHPSSPVVSLFGRQWMVSHDSSYLFSPGCSFSGSNTTVIKRPNVDACAQECKALSQQCLYFVFASSNHDCLLNNNKGNPQFVNIWGEFTCAVVNQYSLFNNVEFMPAKCDCTAVDNHQTAATDDVDDFSFYDLELE